MRHQLSHLAPLVSILLLTPPSGCLSRAGFQSPVQDDAQREGGAEDGRGDGTGLDAGSTDGLSSPEDGRSDGQIPSVTINGWSFVHGAGSAGLNHDTTEAATYPNFAIHGGKLFVTWLENRGVNQVRVAVYNGDDNSPGWATFDGGAATGLNWDPTHAATKPSLTSFNGNLHLLWSEEDGTQKRQVRAALHVGTGATEWAFIDGDAASGLNWAPNQTVGYQEMIVFDDRLYAIWDEDSPSNSEQVRVAVFNGDLTTPTWSFVDGDTGLGINHDTSQSAKAPELLPFNGKLYASWRENHQVRAKVYNGQDAAPIWASIDGGGDGLNFRADKDVFDVEMVVAGGKLYLAWEEMNGSDIENVRAAVYNGNDAAPSWTFIDGGGADGLNYDTTKLIENPQAVAVDSVIYATWYEVGPDKKTQVRVRAYGGDDTAPNWVFIDGDQPSGLNRSAGANAIHPQLIIFEQRLYSTWSEGSPGQIYVAVGK
ncbi:MAG: hypothetical protein JRH20_28765 [Deltaproteobacteria bacterium]|nr:hypothetical protein [Deltaproteobacteria bacterium]